jgi:hypothetical protein
MKSFGGLRLQTQGQIMIRHMPLISREREIGLQKVKTIEIGLPSRSRFTGLMVKLAAVKLSLALQSSKASLPTAMIMKVA